jgi:hypothetical protein
MIDLEYAKKVQAAADDVDCSSGCSDAMGVDIAEVVEDLRHSHGLLLEYLDWDGKQVVQGGKVVGTLRRIEDPPAPKLDLRLKDQLIHDAKAPPMLEYGKVAFPAADFYDEDGKLRVDLDGLAADTEAMTKGAYARAVDAEFKAANEYADAQDARLATGLYDGNEKPGKVHGLTCDLDEDCDCE